MELKTTTKTTRRATLQRGREIIFHSWSLQMFGFSLLTPSVMATSTGTASGASQCSVNTVPIQITNETASGPVTTLSGSNLSITDPTFRAFVTAVTEHVANRLAKDKLCINSVDSKKQSLLQFVKWPLTTSGNEPLAPVSSLDEQPSGGCRITSPWLDLIFERRPIPRIRGVIRWNERQLLADQAILSGARNVPPGVAMPLKQSEFLHFAEGEYAESEVLRQPKFLPIEARVPPDLLWLFRRSWQTTRSAFFGGARRASNIAMTKGADRYTQLVITLIDRCLTSSDGADMHYSKILDIADLISLEQYKITTSIAD